MKFEKKHFISMGISVGVAFLILFLYSFTNIFTNIELLFLDRSFYMRDDKPVINSEGEYSQVAVNDRLNKNILIIGIDETSIKKFGRFPWARSVYAKFLDHIAGSKPALTFFDIFFTEYSRDKQQDKIFFNAVKKYGHKLNLIFDYPFFRQHNNDFNIEKNKEQYADFLKFSLPKTGVGQDVIPYNQVAIPVKEILLYAKDIANAIIEPDSDNKVRRVPQFVVFNNRVYPFIALSIAMNYFDVKKSDVDIETGKFITLKNAKVPVYDDFGDLEKYERKTIKIPIDKYGEMMINYAGYPGEFKVQSQYLSFAEAMDVPKEFFDNKIIMIGAYAQGMAHDIWPSPHGNMYGIEHNANAVNTILKEDFLKEAPFWLNLAFLLFLALLIGFMMPRLKIGLSAIFVVLLIILASIGTLIAFISYNIILYYFAPFLVILFSFSGVLLYRILTEEKEKKFIKKRFSNYVNASVVDELLKNPKALELGGENKDLTVLFSDVRGFTSISEKLGEPQKLVALLNEYLGAMTELIFKYDGTLDKYVGDEIMAFWGAPIPQEDHALRACKSALDQMWYLRNVLNPKLESEGRPVLNIGIGINTGVMTVGNMGSHNRMDYTLMGDNVNLGSRLEGTNKVYKTNIIISEYTYEVVKDNVLVRELDTIRVKGKVKPVKIFELIEVKGYVPGE